MNKQNLHIHSTYADGKNAPEEMVQAAIGSGFDSIGFSEHSYMKFSDFPLQMTEEETPLYIAEVLSLKEKYKDQIEIFCGLELDIFSDGPKENFDYLIGSFHYLDINGKFLGFDRGVKEVADYINNNFGGDGLAFSKKYFETVATCLPGHNIDIIGHFDIHTKHIETLNFVDTSSKEYLYSGYEAIHALQGEIPFFEINSGAIARGYRTSPYPQLEFLKEFQRCGFGAVITSDCHDKNFIDCFYEESAALLREAGFDSKWILTAEGFMEVAL